MNIKIQVNSYDILKRIVGNDDALEIEIANAILASLRGYQLRDFINGESLRNAIINTIFDVTGSSYSPNYKINEKLIKLVDKAIENSLSEYVKKSVIENTLASYKINSLIEKISDEICNTMTSDIIEKRINELADQKIKEKLGIS